MMEHVVIYVDFPCCIFCSTRKYPYSPPPTEGIGISRGVGGSLRPKKLKKCIKFNWNFQRGGGLGKKSLPWGGMYIFWNYTF